MMLMDVMIGDVIMKRMRNSRLRLGPPRKSMMYLVIVAADLDLPHGVEDRFAARCDSWWCCGVVGVMLVESGLRMLSICRSIVYRTLHCAQ
jgi:hypothetical protein